MNTYLPNSTSKSDLFRFPLCSLIFICSLLFAFACDSDDEDKQHQKSRRATGMAGRRSSIAINDDKENKKKRRQSSVGMRRVLV